MKKATPRKLELKTATVAELHRRELEFVIGGGGPNTNTNDVDNRSRTGRCPVG